MKLYYMPGACSLATHIVLEWLGVPYETRQMPREDLKKPEYLKINPMGVVPSLEVNGRVLNENAAILNYLAEVHPDARLAGDGSAEAAAEVNRWLGMVNSDLHPAFRRIFRAGSVLQSDAAKAEVNADERQTLKLLFGIIDKQLQGRDWIAGTRSIADPYLFVVTSWTKPVDFGISEFPNLIRYFERMQKDPGVQKAMKAEGLI